MTLDCKKLISVFISLFLSTSFLNAQQPPALGGPLAATVRIPTHGCSCTVIYTRPGLTYLLGCGHGYQGAARTQKMGLDVPHTGPSDKRKATIKLIAVDYQADLSLVELDDGPLPFVAPVAPVGYEPGNHSIIAAGYDDMEFPPKHTLVHIVSKGTKVWWTQERPIPGRSGGGLIDANTGCLIGVCEGYIPGGRGMYINIDVIHKFLDANFPKQLARPPPQQQQILVPVLPQRRTEIEIPREIRVRNVSGDQCWACALETAARYLKIERLYDLTQKYKRSANSDMVENILNTRHVKHKFTKPGCKDKTIFVESIAAGYPVAFGVRPPPGSNEGHMMLMVGIDDKKVKILANSTDTEVHEDPIWAWEKGWDGWAIVIYPDVVDENLRPLIIEKGPSLPRQEYNYQDVGPVISEEKWNRPQQQIYQQPRYYVPRQQPICVPGGG